MKIQSINVTAVESVEMAAVFSDPIHLAVATVNNHRVTPPATHGLHVEFALTFFPHTNLAKSVLT